MPRVSRQVITAADLDSAEGELRLKPGTIITPSAYDIAAARGISIVFDGSPHPVAIAEPDSSADLASRIDHTNLAPDAVESDILNLCAEAREHSFAAACVNPVWVETAASALRGSAVRVCAVVGFPAGANVTRTKAIEAGGCVESGAHEIDMVANAGWLKDGRLDQYLADMAAVRAQIGPSTTLKVIIEASALEARDIVKAATLAAQAGADFVKTSTGVYGKARIDDVLLLRRALSDTVKIKASGGINTAEDARAMIAAGADRIGSSASVAIVWGVGVH